VIVAIHQPNLAPWMPYFEKLALCDRFVILAHCQFEKGGFTNRCEVWGKWWTNPIRQGGTLDIFEKRYADDQRLVTTNLHWICAIAMTLGIDTSKIVMDTKTSATKTERIVEICQSHQATGYLANPQAVDAYLDVAQLEAQGIRFIPFTAAIRRHPFEMFSEHGIERTKELFWRAVKQHRDRMGFGPEHPVESDEEAKCATA